MPHDKIQEYVNIDYSQVMSVVALTGEPDQATIIAEARFVKDEKNSYGDLAFVVDESVSAQAVEEMMKLAGGELLTEVRLFDLYQGEQIQSGRKSLAYSLVYQAPDRTLTDDEVAEIRGGIIRKVERELGAKLREK